MNSGGLVTVAFLKAKLDEGSDHLGIFMPLIFDVLSNLSSGSFTTAEIQEGLATTHGVAMPQQTVATLLKRATAKKYLFRDAGRYRRNTGRKLPFANIAAEKAHIESGQQRLAEALRKHAEKREFLIESADTALDMLFRFLESEQVGLLLGDRPQIEATTDPNHRERLVVAEFVQQTIQGDQDLVAVLRGMLEGLVLYHAAFLPDLSAATRKFRNLRVVFDSNLVRQALGYEGTAMQTLARETVGVLKASGVQCLVFDKTTLEIHRILAMYEQRLATTQGRASLRPVPMARNFLIQRYSPSDVREMSALLEDEIAEAGFQVVRAPDRVAAFTAGEKSLAARLADPTTKDELEPRVVHDVDCVAGILTLRRGYRSAILEEAQFVFATNSPRVIRNVRLWWQDDEGETGIEPVVHIRALTNLAWLKKPNLCSDFKVRELTALCTAALRPDQATWERFLRHLDTLRKSNKLSSDKVTAILVSAMSDQLLTEIDLEGEDPDDIDATTLDEVVDRVTATYAAEAKEKVQAVSSEYEGKLAESESRRRAASDRADAAERSAAQAKRRRELAIEGRARTWARRVTNGIKWTATVLLICGALALIAGHPFHGGWLGLILGLAVVLFVFLELVGVLKHVSDWSALLEARLTVYFRKWLSPEG